MQTYGHYSFPFYILIVLPSINMETLHSILQYFAFQLVQPVYIALLGMQMFSHQANHGTDSTLRIIL